MSTDTTCTRCTICTHSPCLSTGGRECVRKFVQVWAVVCALVCANRHARREVQRPAFTGAHLRTPCTAIQTVHAETHREGQSSRRPCAPPSWPWRASLALLRRALTFPILVELGKVWGGHYACNQLLATAAGGIADYSKWESPAKAPQGHQGAQASGTGRGGRANQGGPQVRALPPARRGRGPLLVVGTSSALGVDLDFASTNPGLAGSLPFGRAGPSRGSASARGLRRRLVSVAFGLEHCRVGNTK